MNQFDAKPKPLFVHIKWSESNEFNDNEVIPFHEFEERATSIALAYDDLGYLKTKIVVLFSTGTSYECRIDLAKNDEHGFRHHCEQVSDDYLGADMATFIRSIDWE